MLIATITPCVEHCAPPPCATAFPHTRQQAGNVMPKTTPPPTTTPAETEADRLTAWRTQRLEALGYHPEDADLWANLGLDWHTLEQLITKGCPLDTAIRILA